MAHNVLKITDRGVFKRWAEKPDYEEFKKLGHTPAE
jgi:hypothetical protein